VLVDPESAMAVAPSAVAVSSRSRRCWAHERGLAAGDVRTLEHQVLPEDWFGLASVRGSGEPERRQRASEVW
jgi:hypothetical protein